MQCLIALGIVISGITKDIEFALRHRRIVWTIKYIKMWLTDNDVQLCAKFVFDLEFIGDIRNGCKSCHPWEIAVLCVETNQKFYCSILPQLSAEQINTAFTSTEGFSYDFLVKLNAQYPGRAYRMLACWITEMLALSKKSTALLISHNCFASDMKILNRHMVEYGACFTCPTLFFDSLLFCRYLFRGNKTGDFTLQNLFNICTNEEKGSAPEAHRAFYDTEKLHAVLLPYYTSMSGIACFPGSISLTTISGIGTSTARSLCAMGIEDLQHIRHLCLQRYGVMSKDSCAQMLADIGVTFAQDVANIADQIIHELTQID